MLFLIEKNCMAAIDFPSDGVLVVRGPDGVRFDLHLAALHEYSDDSSSTSSSLENSDSSDVHITAARQEAPAAPGMHDSAYFLWLQEYLEPQQILPWLAVNRLWRDAGELQYFWSYWPPLTDRRSCVERLRRCRRLLEAIHDCELLPCLSSPSPRALVQKFETYLAHQAALGGWEGVVTLPPGLVEVIYVGVQSGLINQTAGALGPPTAEDNRGGARIAAISLCNRSSYQRGETEQIHELCLDIRNGWCVCSPRGLLVELAADREHSACHFGDAECRLFIEWRKGCQPRYVAVSFFDFDGTSSSFPRPSEYSFDEESDSIEWVCDDLLDALETIMARRHRQLAQRIFVSSHISDQSHFSLYWQ